MTIEELQKIFPDATSEQFDAISKIIAPQTPSVPPQTSPQPKVKSDSQITMTAAEFMQLMERVTKSNKLDKKIKEESEDDGIYI